LGHFHCLREAQEGRHEAAGLGGIRLRLFPRLQQLLEVLNQLRQFGLTSADRVGDPRDIVLAARGVLALVISSDGAAATEIARGRYK
jgi:hypothetical protein